MIFFRTAFLAGMISTVSVAFAAGPDAGSQQVFTRVFGDAAAFSKAHVEAVLAAEPGTRHYVDTNGDGQPDEVWYIDTALRHEERMRPVLVRVLDEDGDLEEGAEPDLDSDLYVVDWKADGTIDVVLDYTDRDGDQDVDEMAFYFPGGARANGGLMVWWGDDLGDDNLLWYDAGFNYSQRLCQYRTHFGGDEIFSAYILGPDDAQWIPIFENPFVFYDLDNDGVTEEVVRIEGKGPVIHNLRYSYDADNDATFDNPRDFDVSITAWAPEGLTFDPRFGEARTLRGIPTGLFLSYNATRQFSRDTTWASYLFTWDENDLNIDGQSIRGGRFADPQERWEGVLAHGARGFRQVGGPSGGPFNKRNELDTAADGPLQVYFSPTDRRLHLLGAEQAWLDVDYNYDQHADMRYTYRDTTGDGCIDVWELDADLDGKPDDQWVAGDAAPTMASYTFGAINHLVAPVLESAPGELLALCVRLQQALDKDTVWTPQRCGDPAWQVVVSAFDTGTLNEEVRMRLATSAESRRYHLELAKDRLLVALKKAGGADEFWKAFGVARSEGDLIVMRGLVEKHFGLTSVLPDAQAFWNGVLKQLAKPRVAWGQDWAPPNIAWESEWAGYRAYWGQFDFFGKKKAGLVNDTFAGGPSYHQELDWGMDALHVGATPGLGGVTLYVNGTAYPVYSPNGEGGIVWSKRLVSESDDAVTVELLAEKVGPAQAPYTVRFTCQALAGRKDSPISVLIEGGKEDDVLELGVGLTRLPVERYAVDTAAGIMASWGEQGRDIGIIGMGVCFDPDAFLRCQDSDTEHQVVLKAARGTAVKYRIQGSWLRGRRFSRCPTLDNWVRELRRAKR